MIQNFKSTKAAILTKLNKPLLIDRISLPKELFHGQVLVKNYYSGVCGSQLGEIQGVKGKDKYLPHLLGHEAIGEVLNVGKGVKKIKRGDQVLLHWMPSKGLSAINPIFYLRNKKINAGPIATFSDYSIVSENRVTKINRNLKQNKEILLLGCTTSTAIGSVKKLAEFKKNEIAAVAGCGAIGLAIIKTLKYLEAKNIIAIDIDNKKLRVAKKFGAKILINTKKENLLQSIIKKYPNKVDQFFDTTGNPKVVSLGFKCLKSNGNEILIGVPPYKQESKFYTLDINLGKNLIGCKGGNFIPDIEVNKYLKIMRSKKFNSKSLISKVVELKDINDVFSDMKKNKIIGKCIIKLNQE